MNNRVITRERGVIPGCRSPRASLFSPNHLQIANIVLSYRNATNALNHVPRRSDVAELIGADTDSERAVRG